MTRGEPWGFAVDKPVRALRRGRFRGWSIIVQRWRDVIAVRSNTFSTRGVESRGSLLWTTLCERCSAAVLEGDQLLSRPGSVPNSGRRPPVCHVQRITERGSPHGTWKAVGVCCGQAGASVAPQAFPRMVNYCPAQKACRPRVGTCCSGTTCKRKRPAQGGAFAGVQRRCDQTLITRLNVDRSAKACEH